MPTLCTATQPNVGPTATGWHRKYPYMQVLPSCPLGALLSEPKAKQPKHLSSDEPQAHHVRGKATGTKLVLRYCTVDVARRPTCTVGAHASGVPGPRRWAGGRWTEKVEMCVVLVGSWSGPGPDIRGARSAAKSEGSTQISEATSQKGEARREKRGGRREKWEQGGRAPCRAACPACGVRCAHCSLLVPPRTRGSPAGHWQNKERKKKTCRRSQNRTGMCAG